MTLFDKLFRRKILLRPMPDGTYLANNITNITESVQHEIGNITIFTPNRIIRVTGLKNIDSIAIKEFNGVGLIDPFNEDANEGRMSEKMLSDMLDNAEAAGRLMAEGEGDLGNDKIKKMLTIITIASITAAVMGIMIYLKVGSTV